MVKKKAIIISVISGVLAVIGTIFILKLVAIAKINSNIKLGERYYQQGRYREAVIVFEKAVKGDKKKLEARIGLFKSYIAIGEKNKGEKLLIETMEIIPKKKQPYLYLAKFYGEENRNKDALAILKKAWENTKENSVKLLLNRCTAQPESIAFILKEELSKNIGNKLVTLILAPVITFPVNNEVYKKEDIKVTWNKISDASDYFVAVRDLTSGKKIVDDVNVKKNATYNIAAALLTNEHRYCISVGVRYLSGNERWNENACILISSKDTKTISLTASPAITSPASGQVYEKNDINIQWNGVEGATAYIVSILDVTIGDQLVNNYNAGLEKNYRLLGAMLVEGHSYRISVGAKESNDEKWSEIVISIASIRKLPQILEITSPVITAPVDGQIYNKGDIAVAWNTVEGAAEYTLLVKDINGVQVISNVGTGMKRSYVIESSKLIEGHSYIVEVAAKDNNGKLKASEVTFKVSKSIPTPKLIIMSPINGAIYSKRDIDVKWTKISAAAFYTIAVMEENGSEILKEFNVGLNNTYTISSALFSGGHKHKIIVKAFDINGKELSQGEAVITISDKKGKH